MGRVRFEAVYQEAWDADVLKPRRREPQSRQGAWVDLLFLASSSPRTTVVDGTDVDLKRGQLIQSRTWFERRWSWSSRRVDDFFRGLEQSEWIRITRIPTRNATRNGMRSLTICRYDAWRRSRATKSTSQSTSQSAVIQSCISRPEDPEEESPSGTVSADTPPTDADARAGWRVWFKTWAEVQLGAKWQEPRGSWSAYGRLVEAHGADPAVLAPVREWMARQKWDRWRTRLLDPSQFAAHVQEAVVAMKTEPEDRQNGQARGAGAASREAQGARAPRRRGGSGSTVGSTAEFAEGWGRGS